MSLSALIIPTEKMGTIKKFLSEKFFIHLRTYANINFYYFLFSPHQGI